MAAFLARWAVHSDNDALVALVQACPMQGEVTMYFDRSPDFFALSRLQGEGARVAVVEASDGRIVASAAVARFPDVYVNGAPRPVIYVCDLRVHPEHRRGFAIKRIHDFFLAWAAESGHDLGLAAIMSGNSAMAPALRGKAAFVPFVPIATMRNFTVQFILPRRLPKGVTVRRATVADLPGMQALWQRVMASKQFAPTTCIAAGSQSTPGWAIENHFLVFRNERLTGSILTWDQSAFKQMRVLAYSGSMRRMRRWYNPLARVLRRCALPDPGASLPYFYAVRPCAETVVDLRALYVAVHNAHLGQRYLFFSTMLDTRDPFVKALDGFSFQSVDIDLFLIDPLAKWGAQDLGEPLWYFDPSIV